MIIIKHSYLYDLLSRQNLVAWLEAIGSKYSNIDPVLSNIAYKMASEVNGNNLSSWPYYESLYRKYSFKLIPRILDDSKLGLVLYEYGPGMKLTLIGTINSEGVGTQTSVIEPSKPAPC